MIGRGKAKFSVTNEVVVRSKAVGDAITLKLNRHDHFSMINYRA